MSGEKPAGGLTLNEGTVAVRWQSEDGYVHLTCFVDDYAGRGAQTAQRFADRKAPYAEVLREYAWPPTFEPRREFKQLSATGW